MSVKLRLSRGGSKNRPFYHIVAAESRKPRDGRYLEKVGYFDPMRPKDHPERTHIKTERAQYWLGVGAQPTERVQKIFAAAGLMDAPKRFEQTKQHLPKAKAQERAAEAAEKAAAKAADASEATSEE